MTASEPWSEDGWGSGGFWEIEEGARPRYFDKDGTPLGLLEWARKFEDYDYKRVALTRLWNGVVISTVWLGLDHSFGAGAPPLYFETMVFGPLWGTSAHGVLWRRHRKQIPEWTLALTLRISFVRSWWQRASDALLRALERRLDDEKDQRRWSSLAEARVGHEVVCRKWRWRAPWAAPYSDSWGDRIAERWRKWTKRNSTK